MNSFGNILRETAMEMASIAVIVIFVENILFTRAMGSSATLFIVRKGHNLWIFGLILTIITTCSAMIIHPADKLLAKMPDGFIWTPFIYVLSVGAVYVVILLICHKLPLQLRGQITPMIHLAAFNGAVFGSLLLGSSYDFAGRIAFGLGTGIGFLLASYLVSLGYDRLSSDKIPPAFRGFPSTLIYIGILSLAFYGLIGHELSI